MTDDAFTKTLEQETAKQAAMLNGDPGPMINYWADSDDITLFGGWGPIEKGHKPVTDTMRWVGSRFTGADAVELEHLVIASSGDLAYTVGFERSHVSVDGGPLRAVSVAVITADDGAQRSLVAGDRAEGRVGHRPRELRQHVHTSCGPFAPEAFHFLEPEGRVKMK